MIGAGDTAMDAVLLDPPWRRRGPHIVYRRSAQEKGARAEDYERAWDEGVIFDWLTLPQSFLGDENGWVRGVECIRTELGEPDASGRRCLFRYRVRVHDGDRPRRHRPRHQPEPACPADHLRLDVDSHGCIVADPEDRRHEPRRRVRRRRHRYRRRHVIRPWSCRKAATAIHEHLQQRAAETQPLKCLVTHLDLRGRRSRYAGGSDPRGTSGSHPRGTLPRRSRSPCSSRGRSGTSPPAARA